MSQLAVDLFDDEEPMHVPVLETEVLDALELRPDGLYIDATVGAGGHSLALLERERTARVLAFDRDRVALGAARERLSGCAPRVRLGQASFGELGRELAALGVAEVDGLIADIGVSSLQLDEPERGMSFRAEGPLDMRMNPDVGETALELIARLSHEELANVIYELGEERRSRRIARCIKQSWEAGELSTTLELRRAVIRATGFQRRAGIDPATRTFQALRMAVNDELGELGRLLAFAESVVRPGGVVAIISFHSLEDRIVKRAFQRGDVWERLTKKPVIPTAEERAVNPRSRSAKLRAARRQEPCEAPEAEASPGDEASRRHEGRVDWRRRGVRAAPAREALLRFDALHESDEPQAMQDEEDGDER